MPLRELELFRAKMPSVCRHHIVVWNHPLVYMDLKTKPLAVAPGSEDLLEWAWGIIANAGGGNWELESQEWREAAARWRDAYHGTQSPPNAPASATPNTEGHIRRMWHTGAKQWCLVKLDSTIGAHVWVRYPDGRQHFAARDLLQNAPNAPASATGEKIEGGNHE